MPFESAFQGVGWVSGGSVPVRNAEQPQILQYSEVASSETPLPSGLNPVSLLGSRTGALCVGSRSVGASSESERMAAHALRHIQAVAAALPIDAEDERIIDDLMAKRTAGRATCPLSRREGDPR
jgi:hypothetical protein